MKKDRVGLTPIPTDANVDQFLEDLWREHSQELERLLGDMKRTIEQTEDDGEPAMFAYGKLLNYLASDEAKRPKLIRLLAAAIWELV